MDAPNYPDFVPPRDMESPVCCRCGRCLESVERRESREVLCEGCNELMGGNEPRDAWMEAGE
jgi:hypothetical protein